MPSLPHHIQRRFAGSFPKWQAQRFQSPCPSVCWLPAATQEMQPHLTISRNLLFCILRYRLLFHAVLICHKIGRVCAQQILTILPQLKEFNVVGSMQIVKTANWTETVLHADFRLDISNDTLIPRIMVYMSRVLTA